jgi:hypothetical protein
VSVRGCGDYKLSRKLISFVVLSYALSSSTGLYLSDLTFIEEGNPDRLKENNFINFQKCRMVAEVIKQVGRVASPR